MFTVNVEYIKFEITVNYTANIQLKQIKCSGQTNNSFVWKKKEQTNSQYWHSII